MKITVKYSYKETLPGEYDHILDETYICYNKDEFHKILCEFLDLPKGDDNLPQKDFTYEKFKSSVDKYVEQDFIDEEYERIRKSYVTYYDMVTCLKESMRTGKNIPIFNVDKNSIIVITVEPQYDLRDVED